MRGRRWPAPLVAVAMLASVLVVAVDHQPATADPGPSPDAFWACPQQQVPGSTFGDLPLGGVHNHNLECMAWWNVVRGISEGTFAPSRAVTRAQFATFLARLLATIGTPLPTFPATRFDLGSSPHNLSVNQLAELGIVSGRADGSYGPSQPIRRDQLATLVMRTVNHVNGSINRVDFDYFEDDDGNVHEQAINDATLYGIILGSSRGGFRPSDLSTRAQVAAVLARSTDVFIVQGASMAPSEPLPDPRGPISAYTSPSPGVRTVPAGESGAEWCGGHAPTIVGTPDNDVIIGTDARDVIAAGSGDDVVRGFGGDDLICGGTGNDLIEFGLGAVVVLGGPGDDFIAGVGNVADLQTQWQRERDRGGDSFDPIWGAHHHLYGDDGDDILIAGTDEGSLHGGPGDDILEGVAVFDQLTRPAHCFEDDPSLCFDDQPHVSRTNFYGADGADVCVYGWRTPVHRPTEDNCEYAAGDPLFTDEMAATPSTPPPPTPAPHPMPPRSADSPVPQWLDTAQQQAATAGLDPELVTPAVARAVSEGLDIAELRRQIDAQLYAMLQKSAPPGCTVGGIEISEGDANYDGAALWFCLDGAGMTIYNTSPTPLNVAAPEAWTPRTGPEGGGALSDVWANIAGKLSSFRELTILIPPGSHVRYSMASQYGTYAVAYEPDYPSLAASSGAVVLSNVAGALKGLRTVSRAKKFKNLDRLNVDRVEDIAENTTTVDRIDTALTVDDARGCLDELSRTDGYAYDAVVSCVQLAGAGKHLAADARALATDLAALLLDDLKQAANSGTYLFSGAASGVVVLTVVRPTTPAAPIPIKPTLPQERVDPAGTVDTGSDNLNVRSGPGVNYPVIGSLGHGSQPNFVCAASGTNHAGTIRTTNLWGKLAGGGERWVSLAYVRIGELPRCGSTPPAPANNHNPQPPTGNPQPPTYNPQPGAGSPQPATYNPQPGGADPTAVPAGTGPYGVGGCLVLRVNRPCTHVNSFRGKIVRVGGSGQHAIRSYYVDPSSGLLRHIPTGECFNRLGGWGNTVDNLGTNLITLWNQRHGPDAC